MSSPNHHYDPLLVKSYGGIEDYQDLLDADAFHRPYSFSNMSGRDIARYVVATAYSVGAGTVSSVYLHEFLAADHGEDSTKNARSLIVAGLAGVGSGLIAYSNTAIRDKYVPQAQDQPPTL